jgi:pimeloyl-ACP methyl ester carboxylesterase
VDRPLREHRFVIPSRRRLWLLTLLALLALPLVPYLLIDDEPVRLDDAAREEGSHFVASPAGRTHFEITGPDDGPILILVHGTTTPMMAWDKNVAALRDAGFRVVRYDLMGRGLSDRPDVSYGLDLFVTQLEDLVAHLGVSGPVSLAGFSLGGMIAVEFALRHPERVNRVALLAPAGVGTALPLSARIARAPLLGEYLSRVIGTRELRPSRRDVARPERHPELDDAYLRTIRFEGSRRAILGTVRTVPFNGFDESFRRFGDLRKPTLLVWGRQDAVVPFDASARVRALVRPATFLAVDDAGHMALYEQPGIVNAALLEFFR